VPILYRFWDIRRQSVPWNLGYGFHLAKLCTSLKSTPAAVFFIADSMGLSSFTSMQRAPEKATYSKLGCVIMVGSSFKVVEIGTHQKHICDLQLVPYNLSNVVHCSRFIIIATSERYIFPRGISIFKCYLRRQPTFVWGLRCGECKRDQRETTDVRYHAIISFLLCRKADPSTEQNLLLSIPNCR